MPGPVQVAGDGSFPDLRSGLAIRPGGRSHPASPLGTVSYRLRRQRVGHGSPTRMRDGHDTGGRGRPPIRPVGCLGHPGKAPRTGRGLRRSTTCMVPSRPSLSLARPRTAKAAGPAWKGQPAPGVCGAPCPLRDPAGAAGGGQGPALQTPLPVISGPPLMGPGRTSPVAVASVP
jgi:hypothetical protein